VLIVKKLLNDPAARSDQLVFIDIVQAIIKISVEENLATLRTHMEKILNAGYDSYISSATRRSINTIVGSTDLKLIELKGENSDVLFRPGQILLVNPPRLAGREALFARVHREKSF